MITPYLRYVGLVLVIFEIILNLCNLSLIFIMASRFLQSWSFFIFKLFGAMTCEKDKTRIPIFGNYVKDFASLRHMALIVVKISQ